MLLLIRREFNVQLPLRRAWDHLGRIARWPTWAKHIKQIDVEPAGQFCPQSTGVIRLTNGFKCVFKMTEFDPYRSWKWVSRFLWLTLEYDHRFEDVNPQQTRLTFIIEGRGFGVSVFGRLFAWVYAKNLDKAIPLLVEEMNAAGLESVGSAS